MHEEKWNTEGQEEEVKQQRETEGFCSAAGIMSLVGKVALVTGGAQGIGRAVVQSLMQSSAKVSTQSSFTFFFFNCLQHVAPYSCASRARSV